MSSKKLTKIPTFQQVFQGIQKADAYGGIFPEMLINIMLTLPVETATVERETFSQMKIIKTRPRNRLNDTNPKRLMRIAIEGPEMKLVDFNEVLDVFREKI